MTTADEVVAAARALIGTPFAHQHRAPGIGLDCAGVVISVARQIGAVPPEFDITGYSRVPDGLSLKAHCDANLVPQPAPVVGGVVLVAWSVGTPHHLGIVVPYVHGGLAMVHAESAVHRKVIETRLLFGRAMSLVAAYSFPGVA